MTIILHGTNGVTTAGITLGSTAIASTGAELNILDGVTSTAAELNILDGVTSTAAELNLLDGVTSTTAELNILDGVTSTAAELNILDGVTSTAAELNILDGVTTTAAEINLIDGGTARGTTALADGDGILINDAGTMRMTTVQTVKTYMGANPYTAQSTSANGYITFVGGIIIQWGSFSSSDASTTTVTFPIAFPNACHSVTGLQQGTSGANDHRNGWCLTGSPGTSSMAIKNVTAATSTLRWMAMGH